MVTLVRTPPKRPITTAKYHEDARQGDYATTLTAAQLLVAMLDVEVDNIRDLRATLRLDGLRAEERGKGEDEERERYPAEHGGGRRERGGRELQTWSFP